jgi:hypothetical protein
MKRKTKLIAFRRWVVHIMLMSFIELLKFFQLTLFHLRQVVSGKESASNLDKITDDLSDAVNNFEIITKLSKNEIESINTELVDVYSDICYAFTRHLDGDSHVALLSIRNAFNALNTKVTIAAFIQDYLIYSFDDMRRIYEDRYN